MPYHLTAHEPYTERLAGNAVRIWNAGEDVKNSEDVARLSGHPYFVRHWVPDPAPTIAKAAPRPAPVSDPADAPVKS